MPGGPPALKRNAVAAAYLRAAHAYMLISMPTGTSTIFGAFQAILALLVKPDELRPVVKVARIEKFASEIFCYKPAVFMLHRNRNSRFCAGDRQNNVGFNGFIAGARNPEADAGAIPRDALRIKIL